MQFPRSSNYHGHLSGFTVVELVVVMGILSVLVSLIVPAVQFARETSRVAACQNHIRQLAIGCHSFEGVYRRFPPGHVGGDASDPDDFMSRSWVGHLGFLLPHLDQAAVYESLGSARFSFPSDSGGPAWFIDPSSRAIADQSFVAVFRCPSDFVIGGEGTILAVQYPWAVPDSAPVFNSWTNYLGCDGNNGHNGETAIGTNPGIFYSRSQVGPRDITDGLSNTLLLGEVLGEASRTSPDKITHKHSFLCGAVSLVHFGSLEIGSDIGPASSQMFRSRHAGFLNVALADGSGRKLSFDTDAGVLAAIGTRAGNDVLDEF